MNSRRALGAVSVMVWCSVEVGVICAEKVRAALRGPLSVISTCVVTPASRAVSRWYISMSHASQKMGRSSYSLNLLPASPSGTSSRCHTRSYSDTRRPCASNVTLTRRLAIWYTVSPFAAVTASARAPSTPTSTHCPRLVTPAPPPPAAAPLPPAATAAEVIDANTGTKDSAGRLTMTRAVLPPALLVLEPAAGAADHCATCAPAGTSAAGTSTTSTLWQDRELNSQGPLGVVGGEGGPGGAGLGLWWWWWWCLPPASCSADSSGSSSGCTW
mmetsp:Transcript_29559/g.75349  ORF Transcript_29559/g.75349 Transcript_29559/m.75349 type:complete len:272 (+) Transcript_29559:1157-1972(+)